MNILKLLPYLYFGPNGLSQTMENETNREEDHQATLHFAYQEWQSQEPHPQDEEYSKWLADEPPQPNWKLV